MKSLYITYQRGTRVIWAHGSRTIKASHRTARRNASSWASGWGEPRIADSQLITLKEDSSIHSYIKYTLPYVDCQSGSFIRWPDIRWKRAGKMAKIS